MKGKKIAIILSFALCIVYCLPSVPVLADNSVVPGYYTVESTSDLFDSQYSQYIYTINNGSADMEVLNKFSEIDFTNYQDDFGYSYFILKSGANKYFLFIYDLIDDDNGLLPSLMCGSVNNGYISFGSVAPTTGYRYVQYYVLDSNTDYTLEGPFDLRLDRYTVSGIDPYNYYVLPPSSISAGSNSLLYAYNINGVFSYDEYNDLSGNTLSYDSIRILEDVYNNSYGWNLTNFWFPNLPYFDGSDVVDPSGGSGFDNTTVNNAIAFSQYNAYVTYNRGVGAQSNFHTEWAMDQNAFDYSSLPLGWHMHYTMQVSYSVNMSADSAVYKPLINKNYYGDVNVQFDDDLATFASLTNGFRDFTMSEIINKQGAVATGNGVGALSLIVYGMTNNRSTVFGNPSFLGSDLTTWVDSAVAISGIFGYEIQAFAEAIVPTYTYSLDQLEINITAQAWNDNGMRSRYATRHLNMVNGQNSGIAQGAIYEQESTGDTIIVPDKNTNNNVYLTPTYDPTTNDYQLTIQIPEITVNNGYGTDSGSSSSNSSSTSQGGYASASVSIPDNMALTLIDDALEKFMKVMNTPVAYVQPTFWGFFGLFKDNPIADIYEDYFGFLPKGFKDYILALCGIGFGTTVFCACRRKLT